MRRRKEGGFTLLELMITLIIVVILTTAGYMSLSNYLPKQRLVTTARYIENILVRAQSEAYTRSERVGVQFYDVNGVITGELFIDDGATNFLRDGNEPALTNMIFRPGVRFVSTAAGSPCEAVIRSTSPVTSCAYTPKNGCYVFYSAAGEAIDPASGNAVDHEIMIYNPNLTSGPGAFREVEALASGMVQTLKQGQAGNAQAGNTAAGCVFAY